jgi:hypothetical protein
MTRTNHAEGDQHRSAGAPEDHTIQAHHTNLKWA